MMRLFGKLLGRKGPQGGNIRRGGKDAAKSPEKTPQNPVAPPRNSAPAQNGSAPAAGAEETAPAGQTRTTPSPGPQGILQEGRVLPEEAAPQSAESSPAEESPAQAMEETQTQGPTTGQRPEETQTPEEQAPEADDSEADDTASATNQSGYQVQRGRHVSQQYGQGTRIDGAPGEVQNPSATEGGTPSGDIDQKEAKNVIADEFSQQREGESARIHKGKMPQWQDNIGPKRSGSFVEQLQQERSQQQDGGVTRD